MTYGKLMLRLLAATFLALPASSLASGALSMVVFLDDQPAEGFSVRVDQHSLPLNSDAAVHLELADGHHQIDLLKLDRLWHSEQIEIHDQEDMRIIVSLFNDGRAARVEVSSSHEATAHPPARKPTLPLTPGTLKGRVTSAEDGTPLPGVRIYISGSNTELVSDNAGLYSVNLPPGEYAISLMHTDYSTQTLDQIEIGAGVVLEKNVDLAPAGLELTEYIVTQPHVQGSLASVMEQRRDSAAVTDLLAADEIAKAGDSSAASALKRVTGLTLVDGKFIFVRGMGERYSSTLLNGATIPSPDPTRRVVPLDLFPTSVINNIAVQKSFSADLPAEFGGGTVDLRTRGIPESGFFNVQIKSSYLDGSTAGNGLRYKGGGSDFIGFDDGTRALPDDLATALADTRLRQATKFNPSGFSAQEIQQFGRSLRGTFDTGSFKPGPNYGLDLSFGDRYAADGFELGFRGAFGYQQDWQINHEIRREFAASRTPDGGIQLNIRKDNAVDITNRSIGLNGFFTAEIARGAGQHIYLTSLYVHKTDGETRVSQGNDRSLGVESQIRRTRLLWEEKTLLANQIRGSHLLAPLGDLKIDWQFTKAHAKRYAPNERRTRFDDIDGTGHFSYSTFSDNNSILFSNLQDDSKDSQLRATLPFAFDTLLDGQISIGASRLKRHRNSDIRRFQYLLGSDGVRGIDLSGDLLDNILTAANIGPGLFTLTESTQQSDAYVATQTLRAGFVEFDTTFWSTIRLTLGARQEKNLQQVVNRPRFINSAQPVSATLATRDILPSAVLTWRFLDTQQLRAGFGKTLTRPDFRELSDAPFRDPVTDIDTIGNPDLIPTSIRNLDLRWEWYPGPGESLSVAWFSKRLQHPIESILLPGEDRLLTLANADAAQIRGYEFELHKSLHSLAESLHWNWLHGLTVSTNLALIQSNIQLTAGTAQAQTNQARPLQGQSPYTYNLQLGYSTDDQDINATLVLNTFGKRIISVGLVGKPDIFQQAFYQLDFIYKQNLTEHLKLGLQLKNLIDPKVTTSQGPEATRSYKKGRSMSLALNYKF